MKNPIPINIAVEDALSDAVVRKLLILSKKKYAIGVTYSRGGFGYLKTRINGFNNAAKGTPFFVLTDLDHYECPLALIADWLPNPLHPNLIFRIAVKEVEAWLLADNINFARFLGIGKDLFPKNVDDIRDPKNFLISITLKSRNTELKKDLIPPLNSDRKVGPNYNGKLIEFVMNKWDPKNAQKHSISLAKTIKKIKYFSITFNE